MKKLVVLLMTFAMTFSLLTACGSSTDNAPANNQPAANSTSNGSGSDGGATKENPHIWKVGTSAGLVNGKHVIYDLILKIEEEVESATDGRYQIEPYHSSQLGSDRDTIEGTAMGTYQMTVVPGTFCGAYVDNFNVFEFPYLFESADHFFDTMESDVAAEIGAELEAYDLHWLGNGMNGILSAMNSKREIRTVDDFRGLKLRVIDSPMQVGAMECLGAQGTVVNWGETYTACQQNTIDGVITTGSGFLSGKIHEVSKYHTAANIFMTPISVVMNLNYWNSLPAEDQQLIQDAVTRALQWHRETAVDGLNADLASSIEEGGIANVTYDEFDHDAAIAAMEPLYAKYEAQYGELFARVRAVAD